MATQKDFVLHLVRKHGEVVPASLSNEDYYFDFLRWKREHGYKKGNIAIDSVRRHCSTLRSEGVLTSRTKYGGLVVYSVAKEVVPEPEPQKETKENLFDFVQTTIFSFL